MKFIRDLTWPDVFGFWEVNEGTSPAWAKVAIEVKGWPDWRSWRMFTAHQLSLAGRTWKLYEIETPAATISAMLVGPYSGWQGRLPRPNVHTFADLVNIPEQYQHFSTNRNIQAMQNAFPVSAIMTALQRPDGKLVCIEGHHRATAVALAQHDGRTMQFATWPQIAIAELSTADDGLLDTVLARGTTKEPLHS